MGQENTLCGCSAGNLHYQGSDVKDDEERNKLWAFQNEKYKMHTWHFWHGEDKVPFPTKELTHVWLVSANPPNTAGF